MNKNREKMACGATLNDLKEDYPFYLIKKD